LQFSEPRLCCPPSYLMSSLETASLSCPRWLFLTKNWCSSPLNYVYFKNVPFLIAYILRFIIISVTLLNYYLADLRLEYGSCSIITVVFFIFSLLFNTSWYFFVGLILYFHNIVHYSWNSDWWIPRYHVRLYEGLATTFSSVFMCRCTIGFPPVPACYWY